MYFFTDHISSVKGDCDEQQEDPFEHFSRYSLVQNKKNYNSPKPSN